MKIFKSFIIIFIIGLISVSCNESDNVIDQVMEGTQRDGVVLRTLNADEIPSLLTLTNDNNNHVTFVIEVQEGQGDFVPDFKEVRVYASLYQDQELTMPLEDSEGNPSDEILLNTVPSSEFTVTGDHGLPVGNIEVVTQDVVDLYPDDLVYTTPAFMVIRLEIEMTDGRVYTDDAGSGMVASSAYFNSPFKYIFVYINT